MSEKNPADPESIRNNPGDSGRLDPGQKTTAAAVVHEEQAREREGGNGSEPKRCGGSPCARKVVGEAGEGETAADFTRRSSAGTEEVEDGDGDSRQLVPIPSAWKSSTARRS